MALKQVGATYGEISLWQKGNGYKYEKKFLFIYPFETILIKHRIRSLKSFINKCNLIYLKSLRYVFFSLFI